MSLNPDRHGALFNEDDPDFKKYQIGEYHIGSTLGRSTLVIPKLYEPSDLAASAQQYDTGAKRATSAMLSVQNPGLLAFRNKQIKKQEKPVLTNIHMSTKMPPAHNSSLLFKKPLDNLKEPKFSFDQLHSQEKIEADAIAFTEEPISYFSKHKDGRGHRFLYMIPTTTPNDPSYDPYNLKKVAFIDQSISEYYTMSATGITHVTAEGTTDNMTLDEWAKESSAFEAIKRMRLFSLYFYWKQFQKWKNYMRTNRFSKKLDVVRSHPFFYENVFFQNETHFYKEREKAEKLVMELLIRIQPDKKYLLNDFETIMNDNLIKLKDQYQAFVNDIIKSIIQLYRKLSDPAIVQVTDNDFPDIKNRNPNIEKLKLLEKKKAKARLEKTIKANNEIMKLSSFIRVVDYMLIESLTKTCVESFKEANANVHRQQSSIFQLNVYFDEKGNVAFNPKLDVLLKSVSNSMQNALKTLNNLPRLTSNSKLLPLIREGGVDLNEYFEKGCTLSQFLSGIPFLSEVETSITTVLTELYDAALIGSQSFAEFYPIYKLGKTWNPRKYLVTRKGEQYTGTIDANERIDNDDDFLIHSENEPVINLQKVSEDINYFKAQQALIATLRVVLIKGALYVDSKELKKELEPIPKRALDDLYNLIKELSQMKIDMVTRAMNYYSREFKSEPHSLEQFVKYCKTLARSYSVLDKIQTEIDFVDQMFRLLDGYEIEHDRNTLPQAFNTFKIDQNNRNTMKDKFKDPFIKTLTENVHRMERKISHYYEKATAIPATLRDLDIDIKLPSAEKMRKKVKDLSPQIEEMVSFQNAIGIMINDFTSYKNVIAATDFTIDLYNIAKDWMSTSEIITKTQFTMINTNTFKETITKLQAEAKKLIENSRGNYTLLQELSLKINDVLRYIGEVELLSNGSLQARHWNSLFEECGKANAYHPGITLGELITLGILDHKDVIKRITTTSTGESELESKFIVINSYWAKVILPLLDLQTKNDENIMIGDVSGLIRELTDATINLQNMLLLPYVSGVREQVVQLSTLLENIIRILEEWKHFQSNWVVLSNLFAMEDARSVLPHQANRFATVQRKWASIARHTVKDTRLFSVAAYPSLLETLQENNSSIESILIALGKYLDTKRNAFPRLFFLSNKSVLALVATNRYSNFVSAVSKLFMNISGLITPNKEHEEAVNYAYQRSLQKIKIEGFKTYDGDEFTFPHSVSCIGPVEQWIPNVVEIMKKTVLSNVSTLIEMYNAAPFSNWALMYPSYISLLALHVIFTRDVDTAFQRYEEDQKAFANIENDYNEKIKELATSLLADIPPLHAKKIGIIIAALQSFRIKIQYLNEKTPNTSHLLNWSQMIHMNFNSSQNTLSLQTNKVTFEHGLEFYGNVREYAEVLSLETASKIVAKQLVNNEISVITGSGGNGKSTLIKHMAMLFGKFIYTLRPFVDLSEFFFSKILIGAASSGSWLLVADADLLSHQNASYLFDNIRALSTALQAGNPRITISSRLVDLDKTCRVFLTADPGYLSNTEVPGQMKTMIRCVALRKPSYAEMVEIKLSAIGVLQPKDMALSLASSVTSIITLFRKKLIHQMVIPHIFGIIDDMTKNNTYVQLRKNMPAFLAGYTYRRFASMLDSNQITILKDVIFSAFHVGENVKELFEQIDDCMKSTFITKYKEAASDELKSLNNLVPTDYIINQSLKLAEMLQTSNFVIISGPPKSGKTTAMDLYQSVSQREDMKEFLQPAVIADNFYAANTWNMNFGFLFSDLTLGQMWKYGKIHNTLYTLEQKNNTLHILRLDGPLTPKYINHFNEIIGPIDEKAAQLNSLETFLMNEKFKIVIETTSLAMITPSLLSKARILSMNNVQSMSNISFDRPICQILHPSLLFDNAISLCKQQLSEKETSSLRTQFCEMAPKFAEKVSHFKNFAYNYDTNTKIDDGEMLITDAIPTNGAFLAMQLSKIANVDFEDQKQIVAIVAISLFNAYCGIIQTSQFNAFDLWVRQTYQIDCPIDWSDFSIPEDYWRVYPKPNIYSTRFYEGKLFPYPQDNIEKPAALENGSDKATLSMIKSIHIPTIQEFAIDYIADRYKENNRNIMLIGSEASGKSSYINYLFQGDEHKLLVKVPIANISQSSFLEFIEKHTAVSATPAQAVSNTTHYVLLFEDVDTYSPHILEMIRLIIQKRAITKFSTSDYKIHKEITLRNFSVAVTVTNPEKLPVRFISLFALIQLTPILSCTAAKIASGVLSFCGYSNELSKSIADTVLSVLPNHAQEPIIRDVMKVISPLCFIKDKSKLEEVGDILISQLYETSFIHSTDSFKKVITPELLSKSGLIFPSLESIIAGTHVVNIDFMTGDLTKPPMARSQVTKIDESIKELTFHLNVYNSNSNVKLYMQFTPLVVKYYTLIRNVLEQPGYNLILAGKQGTGRFMLTRLITNIIESDFVFLSQSNPEDMLDENEREKEHVNLIHDVIANSVLYNKNTIIFADAEGTNKKYVMKAIRAIVYGDFMNYFNEEGIEQLYSRINGSKPSTIAERALLYDRVRTEVKRNIHIVITADTNHSISSHGFYTINMAMNQDELLKSMSDDLLSLNEIRSLLGTYSQGVMSIIPKIEAIAKEKMSYWHANTFYEFIHCFANMLTTEVNKAKQKHSSTKASIDVCKKLNEELIIAEKRIAEMEPNVTRVSLSAETAQQSYTARREAIEARRTKLEDDLKTHQQAVDKLTERVANRQSDYDSVFPRVESNRKQIEALTENDIETIRISVADPNNSLKLIIEVICIIIGLEPNFETCGRSLLTDGTIISKLLEAVSPESGIPVETMKKVEPYFEIQDLNVKDIEALSPSLKLIYDWIDAIRRSTTISAELLVEKENLAKETHELEAFQEEMRLEKQSIKQVEEGLEGEHEKLQKLEAERDKLTSEFQAIENRKKLLSGFSENIDTLTQRWNEIISNNDETIKATIGDSIICSFYVVFCGAMKDEDREISLKKIDNKLKEIGIPLSNNDPMKVVYNKFIREHGNDVIKRVSNVIQSSLIDVIHTVSTDRPPLLIDPDHIIYHLLKSVLKPKRFVVISQNCTTLDTVLAQAVCDGKIVIVQDVDSLNPIIAPLLPLSQVNLDSSASRDVKVGTKTATFDPRFKLILVSASMNIKDLPDSLLSRVNIVDVTSSSVKGVKQTLVNTFIEFFSPALLPKWTDTIKQQIRHSIELDIHENDMIEILGDMSKSSKENSDFDLLSDEDTFNDLILSKQSLLELLKVNIDTKQVTEEMDAAAVPLKQPIGMCDVFWNVMTRYLPNVSKMAQFSFSNYIKQIQTVFLNEGLHAGTITSDQCTSLSKALVQMVVQFVFTSLPLRDSLLFMFISGFLIKINEGKLKKKDLDAVMKHIKDEYNNNIDTSNSDPGDSDPIEHLKFTNITNINRFVIAFVTEQFPEILSYINGFQIDSLLSNTSTIPTVVYSPPSVDPTRLLHYFLSTRSRNENIDSYSLSDDLDLIRNTRKSLQTSISRGTWVLLHYSKPSEVVSSMLVDIYNQMSTTSVNTNFRLILICSTLEKLSPTMIRMSKRINVESFPSVKHTMLQFFHHNASSIRCTTSQISIKKLSYTAALLLSLMNYRSTVDPIGLNTKWRADDMLFKDIVEWMREVIETNPSDIPIRNIRNQILDLCYSHVSDDFDLRRIRDHLNQMFVPETFDNGFTIARNAKESELWEIINDIPIAEFPNYIKKLPILPPPEVLKMDAETSQPLLSWNASRIFIHPFVKVASTLTPVIGNGLSKLESFQMLIPDFIPCNDQTIYQSSFGRVLLMEIADFNDKIRYLRTKTTEVINDAKNGIKRKEVDFFAQGLIPDDWRKDMHILTTGNTNKAVSELIDRHAYLIKWTENGPPHELDVSKHNHLKEFLCCFLVKGAEKHDSALDKVSLQFQIADSSYSPKTNELVLRKLWMVNGGINGKTLSIADNEMHKTFLHVPGLAVTVNRKVPENDRTYVCPIYDAAIVQGVNTKFSNFETYESETSNLVCLATLPTDRPPREWVFAGTAMYTVVPEQFS